MWVDAPSTAPRTDSIGLPCQRRGRHAADTKYERHGPDQDTVAVVDWNRRDQSLSLDERPILASQVLDNRFAIGNNDASVTAGHSAGIDRKDPPKVPSEDVVTFDERKLGSLTQQEAG